VVSCLANNSFTKSRHINSGCTNNMTNDRKLFKKINETVISKARIGNEAHLTVESKQIVAIEGHLCLKLISNVLYIPEINQNLLSVSQLLNIDYKVLFEDKNYMIEDAKGTKAFKVQMKGKSFVLDFMNEEHANVYKENNNLMLWHKTMRHYHHEALFFMKKNNMVKGRRIIR